MKNFLLFTSILSAMIILATVSIYFSEDEPDKEDEQKISFEARAKQPDRWDFINELIDKRIFASVEVPHRMPKITVGPRWYTLPFDAKKEFASVVGAYYYIQNETTTCRIHDYYDGNQIGYYSIRSGLNLDD